MNHIDIDNEETEEWLDSLYSLIYDKGIQRASIILRKLFKAALTSGCNIVGINTEYRNTIPNKMDTSYIGNLALEKRILAVIRWNAVAMVLRANNKDGGLGGHLSTYASSAVLYEVGFNHFWHTEDLIFMQGHAAPGIYARAFLEGRMSLSDLNNFRQEAFTKGIASYPHPWSMPDFWQFSTVSMGLGPIQAIYQARFARYLEARGLAKTTHKKIWCLTGDGEMDEPESLGAISLAARENLDNLIFVVNCNLQRLDGPVRGNGKIIQELESIFLGAGWNVIKVIWDSKWEELIDEDSSGLLLELLATMVDGEYQNLNVKGGAQLRESFFSKHPTLKKLVTGWSDEELASLEFGGHDINKVYQAYRLAANHKGNPTVIIAKTVKGYGLGAAGESLNIAHNVKKLNIHQLQAFKARFDLPITQQQLENIDFYSFPIDSEEQRYLLAKRKSLGGSLPVRRQLATNNLNIIPGLLNEYISSTTVRTISTTMAIVKMINSLCKNANIGKHIVPIIADEARTFGMEGFFRQYSIYAPFGQLYKPVDSEQVMFYKEEKNGQILQEGITEAGAFCSWLAAATSYSNHDTIMIPFYIYYSMFGFQRIGDLIWAAADMRARGFLIGATSGRTTLAGEGLQHCDGHSHLMASVIPNCLAYDPTFSYELAIIIEDGLYKMFHLQEDVFYYITVMNENYPQLAMPVNNDNFEAVKFGIINGLYLFNEDNQYNLKVQLMASGAILNEAIAAKKILNEVFSISANIWSTTSFNILAKEARTVREKILFSNTRTASVNVPYVTKCFENHPGPVVAATDYVKQYAEQIREFIPNRYIVLGTDGFGFSDTRENLRKLFKVSRYHIVRAAIQGLIEEQLLNLEVLDKYYDMFMQVL